MVIGIVGVGLVGSAIKHGFEKLGHEVLVHDIKMNTSIQNVIKSEICFVCVPTPSSNNGECDVGIVEAVINELDVSNYQGLIAIKSTVEPGTTSRIAARFPKLNISYVPEFLRERCAEMDFIANHDVCIIGTNDIKNFEILKKAHGHYPKKFIQLSIKEAEISKYFNNVLNATLITFANNFYEICLSLGVDYTKVKNAIVNRAHIHDAYLDCNQNFRGFGGVCLPKDTAAMASLAEKLNIELKFFKYILEENTKYETTVFDNMRSE
tara:strand:- start:414 stop:1211 length:798 start_codon:yes stop_codon:yes gene_type:complete